MHPTPILSRAIKRLALTTKQGGKDYYKGTGTGSMGWHTKHGGYIVDPKKVRTYVCPDLEGFGLTPFVARRIEKTRHDYKSTGVKNPMDGKAYLQKWKEDGGVL